MTEHFGPVALALPGLPDGDLLLTVDNTSEYPTEVFEAAWNVAILRARDLGFVLGSDFPDIDAGSFEVYILHPARKRPWFPRPAVLLILLTLAVLILAPAAY